jgi:hypothetical protein
MLSYWEGFFSELIYDGTRDEHDILLKLSLEKHKELIYLAYNEIVRMRKRRLVIRSLESKLQQELDDLEVNVEEYTDKDAILGWLIENIEMKESIVFWRVMGVTFSSEELKIIREWGQAIYSDPLNLQEEIKIVYVNGTEVYVE